MYNQSGSVYVGTGINSNLDSENQQPAGELQNRFTKKFEKR